jgi:hypothetical protein
MKISIALSVVFASTATAFVAPGALFQRQSTTKLEASIKPAGWVATAVVGWTLATQIACATPLQDPLVVVSGTYIAVSLVGLPACAVCFH